jgi:glycine/D-amino acid oxidase-like deaminating enzyme
MARPKVVVIGAGLAGAATAYFLSLEEAYDVTLLEREALPGRHASGRNAAMVRQIVGEPSIAAFAREGARFIRSFAGEESGFSFRRCGALLLADAAGWPALEREAQAAASAGVAVDVLTPEQAMRLVPPLSAAPPAGAVFSRSDGVVDVANLLHFFVREATHRGVSFRFGADAIGVDVQGGRTRAVATTEGTLPADAVVNAGGAWADRLISGRGGAYVPFRRHLFTTGPLAWVEKSWPWVWDVARDVYFRPESGGLLLSPCDEERAEPGVPDVAPRATELLDEKLAAVFPALREDLPVARVWAGLRTFAPDRRFRVGADPEIEGLFAAAALGGHGVTCSAAVGAACASALGESLAGLPPRRSWTEFFTAGKIARAS